jgi:glutamine synthetase
VGLGQHELNLRYAEALPMADRHVIFKQCLKEVAGQQGLSVTFMAKFAADRAGSSCHLHLSLWRDGWNTFAGETAFGPVMCSDTFGAGKQFGHQRVVTRDHTRSANLFAGGHLNRRRKKR